MTLTGPERKPASGKCAQQLIVFLHGLGADGNDLIGLSDHFTTALPDAHFVSPDAPFPCDMAPYGRQWFSLQDRSEETMLTGVTQAVPLLEQFIEEKTGALGLSMCDVALVGFSQGTMLALHTALRAKDSYAGVLGYSGALLAPQRLKSELSATPEICLIHGEADEVVPYKAFEEAMSVLQTQGIMVHGFSREGLGHGIDPAGMQIGQRFLKGVFDGNNLPH